MVTINKMRSLLISLIFVFEYVNCEIDLNGSNESDTCEECLLGCHQKIGLIVETPTCLGIKSNAQLQVYDGIPEDHLTKLSECLLLNECLKKRFDGVNTVRDYERDLETQKPYKRDICYLQAIMYYYCKKRRHLAISKTKTAKQRQTDESVLNLADFFIQNFGKYVSKTMSFLDQNSDVLKQIKLQTQYKKF